MSKRQSYDPCCPHFIVVETYLSTRKGNINNALSTAAQSKNSSNRAR